MSKPIMMVCKDWQAEEIVHRTLGIPTIVPGGANVGARYDLILVTLPRTYLEGGMDEYQPSKTIREIERDWYNTVIRTAVTLNGRIIFI